MLSRENFTIFTILHGHRKTLSVIFPSSSVWLVTTLDYMAAVIQPSKKSALSGLREILATESPLKTMIRKIGLFLKLPISRTREQKISIHILPNILKSKGNQ